MLQPREFATTYFVVIRFTFRWFRSTIEGSYHHWHGFLRLSPFILEFTTICGCRRSFRLALVSNHHWSTIEALKHCWRGFLRSSFVSACVGFKAPFKHYWSIKAPMLLLRFRFCFVLLVRLFGFFQFFHFFYHFGVVVKSVFLALFLIFGLLILCIVGTLAMEKRS